MLRRALPIAAATFLVACGGASEPSAAPATAPATSPAVAPAATAGAAPVDGPAASAVPAALQFSAPLVGGGEIEMGALAGRPVLLWFWAPW